MAALVNDDGRIGWLGAPNDPIDRNRGIPKNPNDEFDNEVEFTVHRGPNDDEWIFSIPDGGDDDSGLSGAAKENFEDALTRYEGQLNQEEEEGRN